MNVQNETVFVIYRNGKPYEHVKKPVYTKKNHATGQITAITKEEAEKVVKKESKPFSIEWYMRHDRLNEVAEEIKKEFEVVEYGPKRG